MKNSKPKYGDKYFVPDVEDERPEYRFQTDTWTDTDFENYLYKKGLICKTKTEAIALAKEMLKVAERRGK